MSFKARYGFLWDSLSPNTGDQAIGATLLRVARKAGIEDLEPVAIGQRLSDRYDLLVIGGGELLQEKGHPFYDLFRVSGEHVLSTVGTGGRIDGSHLTSYRLVSVRSEWDRENLLNLARPVEVVPCLTVLFDEVAATPRTPPLPNGSLGLHINPASVPPNSPDLVRAFKKISGWPVVLVPFTAYNRDVLIQQQIARALSLRQPLPIEGPDAAFGVIRRLGGFIGTSLHATIMAYISGTPFLSFSYAPKVRHFLQERGLANRLIGRVDEIPERIGLLEARSCNWEDRLDRDRRVAKEFLQKIWSVLEEVRSRPPVRRSEVFLGWRQPSHSKRAHRLMIEAHREYGAKIADKMRYELALERARPGSPAFRAGVFALLSRARRAVRRARALVR